MNVRRSLTLLSAAITAVLAALTVTAAASALANRPASPVAAAKLIAGGGPVRAQVETPPARLLVYAQEWSLWPSRATLKPGRVIVQLWNRGQDAHDLQIRRLDARGMMVGSTQGVGVTQSGQLRQATWHLAKGTYELYCSMPGHMKLGMHARIRVT
jgi:plastocyanin